MRLAMSADATTFFESLSQGVAGSSAGGDEIENKLLDQFGFDCGSHTVILLLSGALVQQSPDIVLSELPSHPGGMGGRVLQLPGHLRAAQQIVLEEGQENRLGLQWILMGNPQLERTVTDLQNQFARL